MLTFCRYCIDSTSWEITIDANNCVLLQTYLVIVTHPTYRFSNNVHQHTYFNIDFCNNLGVLLKQRMILNTILTIKGNIYKSALIMALKDWLWLCIWNFICTLSQWMFSWILIEPTILIKHSRVPVLSK